MKRVSWSDIISVYVLYTEHKQDLLPERRKLTIPETNGKISGINMSIPTCKMKPGVLHYSVSVPGEDPIFENKLILFDVDLMCEETFNIPIVVDLTVVKRTYVTAEISEDGIDEELIGETFIDPSDSNEIHEMCDFFTGIVINVTWS